MNLQSIDFSSMPPPDDGDENRIAKFAREAAEYAEGCIRVGFEDSPHVQEAAERMGVSIDELRNQVKNSMRRMLEVVYALGFIDSAKKIHDELLAHSQSIHAQLTGMSMESIDEHLTETVLFPSPQGEETSVFSKISDKASFVKNLSENPLFKFHF